MNAQYNAATAKRLTPLTNYYAQSRTLANLEPEIRHGDPGEPPPHQEDRTMTANTEAIEAIAASDGDPSAAIQEARLWSNNGWTARVIKNEDDEGWAVAMIKDGQAEPALVGPWTMGRNKKDPKPLDVAAFTTLVKTANEVLRRHEQQRHAQLHKSLTLDAPDGRIAITLDIVADEYDPYAVLAAHNAAGETLAQVRVAPGFKLDRASATAWVANDYRRPAG